MSKVEKGVLHPKTFSFEWKITQFFANCQKQGAYHKSPAFPIQYANTLVKWNLYVYPKGDDKEKSDYVSLFLEMTSKSEIEVTVDYEISMLNQQNCILEKIAKTNTFKGPLEDWGWENFVKQNALKDSESGALIDDTLIILCEVKFHPLNNAVNESFNSNDKWSNKIENLVNNFEELLETGSLSDVKFTVQDKTIELHRAILSCRSPVFKAMFEHDMKEKEQNFVEIMDIDYSVMKELFRFIYSGKVQNIELLASDLLLAADKYQVIALKALCEKTLYDNITVDNVIDYLKLTEMCDTIQLKSKVMEFVVEHRKEVVKKPGFADLHNNLMYQIMLAVVEKD